MPYASGCFGSANAGTASPTAGVVVRIERGTAMERDRDRMYDTRSSASGADAMADDAGLGQAPAAADINLPLQESAPVNAPDPRELDGGVEPDRGTRTAAMAGVGVGATGAGTAGVGAGGAPGGAHQPIELVREGMKVVDAAGDEIGKVDFVKTGDPQAVTVSPAQVQRTGGLVQNVADALGGPDAGELPETIAGDLLRVGYPRVDTKGWFSKDRFVPADAITDVVGDTVRIALTKDEFAEA